MPKRSIRSQFLAQRKSLSQITCDKLSDEIQTRLIESGLLHKPSCIGLYSAINNEVLTDKIALYVLKQGKRLAFPRVKGSELAFVEIDDIKGLVQGTFGVPEPQGGNLVPLKMLDLVVVPGVVFDYSGHRLGYGQGYYDRALHFCGASCKKVGIAYEFQVTDRLPTFEHDQLLDVLVTEKRIITFSPADSDKAQAEK